MLSSLREAFKGHNPMNIQALQQRTQKDAEGAIFTNLHFPHETIPVQLSAHDVIFGLTQILGNDHKKKVEDIPVVIDTGGREIIRWMGKDFLHEL